jgi:hypothetical protein
MTYGWAILALIIIVVILVNSGALSPSFIISQECNLGSNMPCSFLLYNKGITTNIQLTVGNGFSYAIKLRDVQLQTVDGTQNFTFKPYISEIKSGDSISLDGILNGGQLPDKTLKRFVLSVSYAACSPEIAVPPNTCSSANHTLTGRLTGKVEGEK